MRSLGWWWVLIIIAAVIIWRLSASVIAADTNATPLLHELRAVKAVFTYTGLAFVLVFPLIRGGLEYQETGSLLAFFPFLAVVAIFGGVWAWFGHFATHGGFLLWPILIGLVVLVLQLARAFDLDRKAREHAEEMKEFPEPPKTGGPAERKDFKDWV